MEYQLAAITKKYNLREDEQRVKYIAEAAEFVSTLPSAVQREVYGTRAAEAAGISFDAMKIEVNKAFKRRMARERKKQEKIDLAPARNLQPHSKNFRYDNIKSAMAEETVIAMGLKEPALLDKTGILSQSHFSSDVLGRVFSQMAMGHAMGREISLGALTDFTSEEMAHVAGILQRQQGPVNEQAFHDCIRTILDEHGKANVDSNDALMAARNKMKEKKGIRG